MVKNQRDNIMITMQNLQNFFKQGHLFAKASKYYKEILFKKILIVLNIF